MNTQNIETPWPLVKEIERILGIKFKYDLAGSHENKKAQYVITEEEDSLNTPWPKDGWGFLNPPFKKLSKFTRKCVQESFVGAKFVTIWPLSSDFHYVNTWRVSYKILIIHGRIWKNVRGCMVCQWYPWSWLHDKPFTEGYTWDGEELTFSWVR